MSWEKRHPDEIRPSTLLIAISLGVASLVVFGFAIAAKLLATIA